MTIDRRTPVVAPAPGRLPVAGPWITELELAYITDAAATGWYSGSGSYPARFEAAFADVVTREFAIALPSCTSALHLALLAAGVGPGDRVAVPDVTWIASAAPVMYVGAEPVFVDIDPESWCIDAASFAHVADSVAAVIPVDLYGNVPDWAAILDVALAHGVTVIEDSAEAIGSRYHGQPAGSFGLASVFSFHGSKTVTTGEGGMLVTDSSETYERCRFLADHGRLPGDVTFRNAEVAYKYKMSALQAACGLAQIERLDELVERKRSIFGWYQEELSSIPGLTLNTEAPGVFNSYWMVTIIWDAARGLDKYEAMEVLRGLGVDTRPMFAPLSSLAAYADAADRARAVESNSVAYDVASRGLNLPSGLHLEQSDVQTVADAVRQVFAR